MKRFAKFLLILIVLGGAVGAGWYYFFGQAQAQTAPNTVSVGRGDIETTVLASGVLEAPANNHIQRTADAGAMDGPPPMEVRRVQTGSRAFFDGKGPPGAAFDPRWVR